MNTEILKAAGVDANSAFAHRQFGDLMMAFHQHAKTTFSDAEVSSAAHPACSCYRPRQINPKPYQILWPQGHPGEGREGRKTQPQSRHCILEQSYFAPWIVDSLQLRRAMKLLLLVHEQRERPMLIAFSSPVRHPQKMRSSSCMRLRHRSVQHQRNLLAVQVLAIKLRTKAVSSA